MPWSISSSTLSGGSWLSVFPQSGQTDAASPIVPQARVAVNPQGLAAGTYYGQVQVSSTGATNDPQVISVVLTVLPPGSNLGPIIQPAGIIFTAVSGAQPPSSQTVTVQSTGSGTLNFTSGHVTTDGSNWFQTLPQSGTVTSLEPAHIVIQPDTSALGPGVYRGSLTISFSDGNTRNVALLLVVVPGLTGSAQRGSRRVSMVEALASCKPTLLAPLFTGIADNFAVPAAYPNPIVVRVVDDCANPMVSGGVTTTFNNGDPPLRLTSLKDGSWTGTWVPRGVASRTVLTAIASIPEQNLNGQVQIQGGTAAADQLPVINVDGVVNAASFASAAPLAPGSLVAVFGANMTQGQGSATTVPLPVSLAGGSILIGGKQAPLLFASNGQVNAVVPFGITPNSAQQAIATRGNTISVPQPLTIASAAPGVFTSDGKQAIVVAVDLAGNQTLVDAAHPAKAGDVLVIYCTGLGEVYPQVPTGNAAPLDTLSYTVNPVSVTIGGLPAAVQFSGLTPTEVGLYQVNAVVPPGIMPGSVVSIVLSSGGQLSTPAFTAIQ
jgi:uncharacterized protein (TIGR03437 family)